MNLFQKLIIIACYAIVAVTCYRAYLEFTSHPLYDHTPQGEHIWVVSDQVSHNTTIESINNVDTVTVEFKYDLLTFIPTTEGIVIYSEVSTFPIATFDIFTARNFLQWVLIEPMDENESGKYSNHYYQSLIEEKIWE
jgi:hypothetical protein